MRSLLLVLLAFVAAVGVPVVATTPASAAAGERYVALGDSYAAGLGLGTLDTSTNAEACGRTATNYPHQVAKALGLQLTDVTCSGAVIADLAGSQQAGGASVPPQFDALGTDTRLVTLTVGGNDLGFSRIAQYCASLAGPDGPVRGGDGQAADCESHYVTGGDDTLADDLTDTVGPALDAALATIRERAPSAAVLLVDYPALVPDAAHTPSGGCWSNPLQTPNALPFTTADLPYLQRTQARLNQLLQTAASEAGQSSVSVYTNSLAHTACSSAPWVNGIRLQGFSVAPSSLHPTAAGVTALTGVAVPAARSLLAGGTVAAPPSVAPEDDGSGPPTALWIGLGVGVVVVLIVVVGGLRVARRRR